MAASHGLVAVLHSEETKKNRMASLLSRNLWYGGEDIPTYRQKYAKHDDVIGYVRHADESTLGSLENGHTSTIFYFFLIEIKKIEGKLFVFTLLGFLCIQSIVNLTVFAMYINGYLEFIICNCIL